MKIIEVPLWILTNNPQTLLVNETYYLTIPYVAVSIVKIKSKNIKQSELNNVPSNECQMQVWCDIYEI